MSSADPRDPIATSGYWLRTRPRRYGFALLAVIAATLLRYGLGVVLGLLPPFVLLFPAAIILVAVLAGFGPGIFATVLSTASISVFFAAPLNLFGGSRLRYAFGLMFFAVIGSTISYLADKYRRHEGRLREFERAVEGLDEMIVVVDRDYRYVLANQAFRKYRGVKTEDVIGRRVPEILSPTVFDNPVKAKLDECFRGKVVQFEVKCEYPSLGERDIFISYFPIAGSNGVDRVVSVMRDVTERKQSEVALAASEGRFRAVYQRSPVGIALVEADSGRFLEVNPSFCEILGRTKEEVQRLDFQSVTHPDDLADNLARRTELREGSRSHFEVEKRYLRPDGEVVWAQVTVAPLWDPQELHKVYLVMAQDINERKRAGEALQLFRTLIDNSNDAVEVVDPETLRFLDVNQKACEDLGYKRDELLGLTVPDINPNVDESERVRVVEKLRSSGSLVLEGVHRRKDGSLFPVETSLRYVRLDRNYIVTFSRNITQRKQVENALRDSEDRYRDLVEHSEDLVCTHDLEGHLLSANPAPARMLGYEVKELLGIPMRELIAPDFRDQFDDYLARIKKNGADKGKLCIVTRSGERRIWEYNNTLRTEGVASPVVRGMARDITEQKRAQGALRSSEQRYRMLFEKSVAGVAILSVDGRVVNCNDAWARMFGHRDAKDCCGCQIANAYPDPAYREVLLGELRRRGAFYNREMQLKRKDGTPFWVLINSVLLTEGQNEPLIQSTVFDITESKQAEEALRASEQRYRFLFEKSVAGVATASSEGRVLDCNDAWAHMLGYENAHEICGRSAAEFYFNPAERESLRDELQRSGSFRGREMRLRRKDGTPVWVLFNCAVVTVGETPVIQATAIDISERKKAEDLLRRREEDYRSFVAQSSEGIFRQDLDKPIPIDLPEDEVVHRILCDSYLAECNDAIATMYGLTVRDFVGKRLTETLDPNDPRNIELCREYVRSGFRVLERESHEMDMHGHPKVFRNSMIGIVEHGMLMRTWGIQRDVTEQVRLEEARGVAEKALQKSEAHFRILVEQASDGIFIADAEGKYLDVNSAGAEMLGYTREEILKLSIPDVIVAQDAPRVAPEVARFNGGAIIRSEWTFRRKDGSLFPGEVSGKQLPDGRLQGILRDMTERRLAEESMRRNEERFRVALKDSPIAVFNQDRDLRYTWIYNPHFYWQNEAIGKTDDEILGQKKAAKLVELKRRVLQTGTAVREEVVIPHNSKNLAFDVTIEPLLNADGEVVGITGSSTDVARLREMADRLQDDRDKLAQEKSYLEGEIQAELGFEEIIGQSPALREVLKKARVVAPTDSTVLLLGETGTGKELVARSVHSLSSRRDKTFIKLNCAAVPSGLLESELFGHEKGAFTGAVNQKIGRIELAHKGTLFLDEIGELPVELQPKLLRVLQDREFERLGGVHTLHVDVRIISATNRDLQQDIADKKFREDLFYRLNVFPIELPALRERRSDIPVLVGHFVRKHSARMGKHIDVVPDETMAVLENWNWPGNIRELENMIERMVILSKGRELAAPPKELDAPLELAEDDLTEMEREHIIRVLRETNGVIAGDDGAAVRLGLKRTTLQSMLKRFNIDLREYRRGTGTFGTQ